MIYLIKTDYIDGTLLKIGYTNDRSKDSRFRSYKMHNPKSVVLFTIPGGTEKHEKAIHNKFRSFLYSDYGNEWFNFDQSIIDFFTIHTTKESLENDLIEITTVDSKDIPGLHKEINRLVNRWLCLESDTPEKLYKNYYRIKQIITDCRNTIRNDILKEEDILPYLIEKYDISDDIQSQLYFSQDDIVIKFKGLPTFRDRMKFLCKEDIDNISDILNQIPLVYKVYYIVLGPERCKALNYEVTKISKEFSDMQFDKSQLEDEIYKTFTIGERYTKSRIKETLKNLYKFLGYNKTPKANDLEKYFELKECKVLVDKESGKRDMGFEIIKRKENFDD